MRHEVDTEVEQIVSDCQRGCAAMEQRFQNLQGFIYFQCWCLHHYSAVLAYSYECLCGYGEGGDYGYGYYNGGRGGNSYENDDVKQSRQEKDDS